MKNTGWWPGLFACKFNSTPDENILSANEAAEEHGLSHVSCNQRHVQMNGSFPKKSMGLWENDNSYIIFWIFHYAERQDFIWELIRL